MKLTLEHRRWPHGRSTLTLQLGLVGDDVHNTTDRLTERALLLHDEAMELLRAATETDPRQPHHNVTVDEADDPMPETRAAVLDLVRSMPPTSNTPPEREAAKVRLRAEIIKLRRDAGYSA